MQALDVATSHTDPAAFRFLHALLPASIVINTFANFFTLLISLGAYGPARRFWQSFEVFIALAWLFFLMALTLSIIAQMILTYQRENVLDAFNRGRGGYGKWRDGGMGNKTWYQRSAVGLLVKVPFALLIMFTTLFGFLFCSLCVVSHCLAVGWIGFIWVILLMILAIVSYVLSEHA